MKKILIPLVCSSVIICNSALASGVPTVDAVNATNQTLDYIQQLKIESDALETLENRINSYSTQLQEYSKQIQQYEQQITDTTKTISNLTNSVSDLYTSGKSIYSTVDNALTNASDVGDYVTSTFGDKSYWEKCSSSGCDPTSILTSATTALSNSATNSLGAVNSVMTSTDKLMSKSSQIAANLSSEKGINGSIQNLAQLQQISNQQNAELSRALLANMQMQAERIKSEETKKKADAQALANYVSNDNYKIEDHSGYSLTD